MTNEQNNGINFDQHKADADTLPTKAALIPNLASPGWADGRDRSMLALDEVFAIFSKPSAWWLNLAYVLQMHFWS